jgi:hypothetical protein
MVCAVAALAATALLFAAPESASAYCRGCVVEPSQTEKAELVASAHAEAPVLPPVASCHLEKQLRPSKGPHRWRFVEICE